jgi:hypothetical protein
MSSRKSIIFVVVVIAMLVATGVMLGTAVAQRHQHRNRRTIWHSERARSRSCFSSCIPTTMAKSLSKSL